MSRESAPALAGRRTSIPARVAAALCAVVLSCSLVACSGEDDYENDLSDVEGLDELGAVTVVAREEGSGTRTVFSETVGLLVTNDSGVEEDVTTEDAIICEDAEAVIAAVQADSSAIGYVSLAAVEGVEGIKVIAVQGVTPTTDTVEDGSYALTRNFYLVFSGTLSEVEYDFLSYILTAGQDIVAEGYVQATSTTRFLSDRSSGTITISGSTSVAPLIEELAAAYLELNSNAEIVIEATDSTSGINAAMTGDSDFGMSSRDLEDYEEELLDYEIIAVDAVAVIVNEDNPIDELSLEQLYALFSGDVATWAELA